MSWEGQHWIVLVFRVILNDLEALLSNDHLKIIRSDLGRDIDVMSTL